MASVFLLVSYKLTYLVRSVACDVKSIQVWSVPYSPNANYGK